MNSDISTYIDTKFAEMMTQLNTRQDRMAARLRGVAARVAGSDVPLERQSSGMDLSARSPRAELASPPSGSDSWAHVGGSKKKRSKRGRKKRSRRKARRRSRSRSK